MPRPRRACRRSVSGRRPSRRPRSCRPRRGQRGVGTARSPAGCRAARPGRVPARSLSAPAGVRTTIEARCPRRLDRSRGRGAQPRAAPRRAGSPRPTTASASSDHQRAPPSTPCRRTRHTRRRGRSLTSSWSSHRVRHGEVSRHSRTSSRDADPSAGREPGTAAACTSVAVTAHRGRPSAIGWISSSPGVPATERRQQQGHGDGARQHDRHRPLRRSAHDESAPNGTPAPPQGPGSARASRLRTAETRARRPGPRGRRSSARSAVQGQRATATDIGSSTNSQRRRSPPAPKAAWRSRTHDDTAPPSRDQQVSGPGRRRPRRPAAPRRGTRAGTRRPRRARLDLAADVGAGPRTRRHHVDMPARRTRARSPRTRFGRLGRPRLVQTDGPPSGVSISRSPMPLGLCRESSRDP